MLDTDMATARLLMVLLVGTVDFPKFGMSMSNKEQYSPQQTHITYGKSVQEVVIMWSTKDQCSPKVSYGTGPFNQSDFALGVTRILDNHFPNATQIIHRVVLQGLTLDTTYYYTPICNEVRAGPYIFKTPDLKEGIQMMVISDVSSSSPAINHLINEAVSGKYSALLHLGNIAMNLSSDHGENGNSYLTSMEQAIKTVPYLTAPGPSEVEDGSYSNYNYRFSMAGEWPMSIDKLWYSIDIGVVHLISYTTEVFHPLMENYASMQHDWLLENLKSANKNRGKVPWIIAFGHRPMYCSYEDPLHSCNERVQKGKSERSLEDIFFHFGVDVIIESYGRAYERSFPMYKSVQVSDNYTDPLGPVHIISGGASPWKNEYNFTTPAPVWSAFRYTNESVLSYGRLNVINASMLMYEQINAIDGSVIDSFEIVQEKHGQFSTETLSPNKSAEIDRERMDSGGKPGVLNIEETGKSDSKSRLSELLEGDNRTRLIIGVSCASFAVAAIITILFVKTLHKKRKVTRRWEQMDINYGKKFYSKAPEKDEDNDFEIDMSDGTEPTRKLLNADD